MEICEKCIHDGLCISQNDLSYCEAADWLLEQSPCELFKDKTKYVEQKHGRWEKANKRPKSYIYRCTACGKEAYFCGTGCGYKFCPNCGANMNGKAGE